MKLSSDKLLPALLFAAVAAVSLLFGRYSLEFQENCGLFLLTGDWLREVLSAPLPLSHIIGSFLVQYYDSIGWLITAALTTLTYLCISALFRRFGIPFGRIVAMAGACAVWYLTALKGDNTPAVAVLLCSAAALAFSCAFCRRQKRDAGRIETAVCLAIAAVSALAVCTDGRIRYAERLAKVQVCARKYRWSDVLQAATPKACAVHPELMPFAFLALGETGGLADHLFDYPVRGPEDFDMQGLDTPVGNFFNMVLNESLKCPNEALHQAFQFSCHLPHGMSHVSLYQYIKYNIMAGNYTMVRKYAWILSRNPKNRRMALSVLKQCAKAEDKPKNDALSSAVSRVMSKNPVYNLGQMNLCGIASNLSTERFLCYYLLQGDMDGFAAIYNAADWPGKAFWSRYLN